jgi:hypothetical protein
MRASFFNMILDMFLNSSLTIFSKKKSFIGYGLLATTFSPGFFLGYKMMEGLTMIGVLWERPTFTC